MENLFYYLHKEVVYDKNAPKAWGYVMHTKRIKCKVIRHEGDEVIIRVKKTKYGPAGDIRVMERDLIKV